MCVCVCVCVGPTAEDSGAYRGGESGPGPQAQRQTGKTAL